YVLTMIDVFSRYVWVIPLYDKGGDTIHWELVKIFTIVGPPNKLQVDNESEFITDTQLIHDHMRHSQSQGKIERFNQMLGYRWIDILQIFVIAYNKTPHSAHDKSPYEAFFGFKIRDVYSTPGETVVEENVQVQAEENQNDQQAQAERDQFENYNHQGQAENKMIEKDNGQ
ncbi:9033_t:CDS:2, partial [Ambispora gerdemannii]